jgi:hypothetical protein
VFEVSARDSQAEAKLALEDSSLVWYAVGMEIYAPSDAIVFLEERAFEAENENYHTEAGVLWDAVDIARNIDVRTVFFIALGNDYEIFVVDPTAPVRAEPEDADDPGPFVP